MQTTIGANHTVNRTASTIVPRAAASHLATRENNFDLLRLLAALQVAFFHGASHLQVYIPQSVAQVLELTPGVPVFFAISGFLVTASFVRSSSFRQYFLNRALRVFPAMWVCLAISVAIVVWFGLPFRVGSLVLWVAAQASVGQFWNPEFIRGFGVGVMNGSLWTIPVELQFYMIVPVLYHIAARYTIIRRRLNVAQLFALSLVCGGVFTALSHVYVAEHAGVLTTKLYVVTIIPWLYYFLVGWAYRYVYSSHPGWFADKALYWGSVYLAWTAFAHFVLGWDSMAGNNLNPVSVLLLGGFVISCAFTRPALAGRILKKTDVSYGVYIYHMIVVNLFVEAGIVGTGRALSMMLALTMTLAFLSWRMIEKPVLSLKYNPWLLTRASTLKGTVA